VLVLALLPAAAQQVAQPELLNSERIEARFGSYGIDVVESDSALRVSNLFSTDASTGIRTVRTAALVQYPGDIDGEIAPLHEAIVAGGSIGATFKSGGWRVLKTHLYFGEVRATAGLSAVMRLGNSANLAIHIYSLSVERRGARHAYAKISEIHHPDYLKLETLTDIYAPAWSGDLGADVAGSLRLVSERLR